ncbi:MAG: ribonuclease P protein component [Alphaproteobacteria bacterium]
MRIKVGRLTKRPDFLRVAGGRQKWAAPGFVLQARRSEVIHETPACRVGFTATRKIGSSVVRNRARRRLRAAAAEVLPSHAMPGFDFVLIARAETNRRPYAALIVDLIEGLRRLGALRKGEPTP